jgi:hypothetical protein
VNTGKVRFVYKHFAILGPESNRSAEASECAAEQGQFWAYHDRVFAEQGQFWAYHDRVFADQNESRSSLSAERLGELAGEVGLDTTTFNECLNSGRYASLVSRETFGVQSLGVRGTPAFLINGVFVSGAQPFEVFQQVFEEQLGQAQSAVESAPPTAEPVDPTSSAPPSPTNEEVAVEDKIEGVVIFPEPSLAHQDGEIAYPQPLPAGGDHSDEWQNCGIYDQPVPTEPAVHSLEHGAVWIAYRPDLPPDQVETLRALVRQERQARGESLVLLAPVAEASLMDTPIVATAWRTQLQLDNASDERLRQFLSQYQNGPFTPEPEASCSGSVGEPLE